jgi:hypothetical protein
MTLIDSFSGSLVRGFLDQLDGFWVTVSLYPAFDSSLNQFRRIVWIIVHQFHLGHDDFGVMAAWRRFGPPLLALGFLRTLFPYVRYPLSFRVHVQVA